VVVAGAIWLAVGQDVVGRLERAGHVGTTSSTICAVPGGPDWLFPAMLITGGIGIVYGALWVMLLVSQGEPVPARSPRFWWLGVVFCLVPTALQAVRQPAQTFVATSVFFVLTAPALATSWLMNRRAVATGVGAPARSAPWGMFWVLVAVSVVAVLLSVACLAASLMLGHQVPC